MQIRHAFESEVVDGGDDTLVQPSDWNAEHVIDDMGGIGAEYIGNNTIGGTWESPGVNSKVYLKKVILANDGFIANIGAYIQIGSASSAMGISSMLLDDNAGSPGELIAHGASSPVYVLDGTDPRWMEATLGAWVTAGTYWLGIRTTDTGGGVVLQIAYDATGTDQTATGGGNNQLADAGRLTLTVTANNYSIRALLLNGVGTAAGFTQDYIGHADVGASWFTITAKQQYCKQVTLVEDMFVSSIEAYLRPSTDNVGGLIATVLSDNSGNPGTLLASSMIPGDSLYLSNSASMPGAGRWFVMPIGVYLTAGTYWLCIMGQNNRFDLAYDASVGADKTFTSSLFIATGAYPSAWSISSTTDRYSIRANTIRATPSSGVDTNDPVIQVLGVPDTAFEFDTSSLTGLTTFGSPDTVNANTTLPDCLYLKDTNTTWQFCGVYAAATPPFTAIVRVVDDTMRQDYQYACMFVGESPPGKMDIFGVRYNSAGVNRGAGGYLSASPTDSSGTGSVGGGPAWIPAGHYIAMVVNTSSDIRWWFSQNGYVWRQVASGRSLGGTVGVVGITINAGQPGGGSQVVTGAFDYLRIWNSVLTLPGAA